MKPLIVLTLLFLYSNLFTQLAPRQIIMPLFDNEIQHIDINGDGFKDILGVTPFDEKLAWIENENGSSTFLNQRIIAEVSGITNPLAADIDGDSDIDILYVDSQERITYFANMDGQGNFVGPQYVRDEITDPCGVSFAVADLNQDGLPDVLFSENCNINLGWYQNLGSGFSELIPIADDLDIQVLHPIDIDLDGDIDIISYDYDELITFENLDGNATFSNPIPVESNLGIIRDLEFGDLNGDGYLELIYAVGSNPKRVVWKINNGDTTFGSEQALSSGNEPNDIDIGDVDGDGDLDIVTCFYLDNLTAWFENTNGQGNFSPEIKISSNTGFYALEYSELYLDDVDSDGDLDILATSFTDSFIGILENIDGTGYFAAPKLISAASTEGEFGIADVDGIDGKELIYTSKYGLILLRNLDGEHHFSTTEVLKSKAGFTKLTDFNGDGFLDILVHDSIPNPNNPSGIIGQKMVWLQNDGIGNFSTYHVIHPDYYIFQAIADVDLDGDMDLIAKKNSNNGFFYLFENEDGLGSFSEPQELFEFSTTPVQMLLI